MGWINLKLVGLQDSIILKFMKEFKSFNKFARDENIKILKGDIRNKVLKGAMLDTRRFYEDLEKNNITLLEYTDDKYPVSLKNIQDPPLFL